jgi:hypothetical protein
MEEQINNYKACYIANARLKDAPQVRISSRLEPFMSVESCRNWCMKHTFSWVIKEWNESSPSINDKILAKE